MAWWTINRSGGGTPRPMLSLGARCGGVPGAGELRALCVRASFVRPRAGWSAGRVVRGPGGTRAGWYAGRVVVLLRSALIWCRFAAFCSDLVLILKRMSSFSRECAHSLENEFIL